MVFLKKMGQILSLTVNTVNLVNAETPLQVALDEAAFLLDLASIDGTWGDYLDRIAECYKEAGLGEIANFILYRD